MLRDEGIDVRRHLPWGREQRDHGSPVTGGCVRRSWSNQEWWWAMGAHERKGNSRGGNVPCTKIKNIDSSIFSKLTPRAVLNSSGYELFRLPSQVTLDQILAEI